jgi:hypothetical protein
MTGILIKSAIVLGVGFSCAPAMAQTEQAEQGQSAECLPGAECSQPQGEQGQQPEAQSQSTDQGESQSGQQDQTMGKQPGADQDANDQTKQGAAQPETQQQNPDTDTSQSGTEQQSGQSEQSSQDDTQQPAADPQQTSSTKADVTVEQKAEITQIIKEENVEPVAVDIDLSVGVVVPQTVKAKLRPVPARIVKIVPRYEGYSFFILADGRIVIVEPSTLKVVVILA